FVPSMTDVISYRSDWRTKPFAVLPSISAKLPSQKTVARDRVEPLVDEDIEAPGVEARRRRRDRPDHSRTAVIEASPQHWGDAAPYPRCCGPLARCGGLPEPLRPGQGAIAPRLWCGTQPSPLWQGRLLGRPSRQSTHLASAS